MDHNACGSAEYLAKMPLPSTKSMWNSHTELDWTQEYMLSPVQSDSQRLLMFQDLVSYQTYNERTTQISNVNDTLPSDDGGGLELDQWLAHVDEIGTLVVTAARFSRDAFPEFCYA